MTQSQSRPRTPASWHPAAQEREGLWILTRLRDFVDDIANTSPARLALTIFAGVCLVFTLLLSLPAQDVAVARTVGRCTRPCSPPSRPYASPD